MNALCCFLFVTIFTCVSSLKIKEDLFNLPIIHFSDFHARFEETSPTSTKCIESKHKCIGGISRLYTAIKSLQNNNPTAIVLNAGDSFQGTIWYNLLGWNITQYYMNMLPIDAHTLGNHEFDHKIDGVTPYLKNLKAPVVTCNIDDSLEPRIQNLYNKSTIIERNGRKIGIIGVLPANTQELSQTEKLIFTDANRAVQLEADKLTKQNVNIIVVLSHCGLECDRSIAQHVGNKIDIIVGGHSHLLLYNGNTPNGEQAADVYPVVIEQSSGPPVLIVHASAFTKYLGFISLSFNARGEVVNWKGNPIYLDNTIKQDETILKSINLHRKKIEIIGKVEVGQSRVILSRKDCKYTECNIGSFISDAIIDSFVEYSDEDSWTYVAATLINQGGLRGDINDGPITYEDVLVAQPFFNLIFTVDIKGIHILEALEFSVNRTNLKKPFSSNAMLQVSGLRIVFNVTKPPGHRVVEAKIRCARCKIPTYSTIQPDTVYKLAVTSFIANGGDGFSAISKNKMNAKSWGVDTEIVIRYIKRQSPIAYGVDRRIIVLT